MPPVRVIFYQERDRAPVQDWIHNLSVDEQDACYHRLERIRDRGYELGFPAAEHLGDGIWELRTRVRKVRLRMLYFFHESGTAVVTHGFHKDTKKVPAIGITRAKAKRTRFRTDPELHTRHWRRDDE